VLRRTAPGFLCAASLTVPLLACSDTEPHRAEDTRGGESWVPLVEASAWAVAAETSDPFPEHRPAQVECLAGFFVEGDALEVDTGRCNFLSVSQPLRADVLAGDVLRVEAWWQTLASESPAEAHLALAVGGHVLWEETIPIPSPADARSLEWAAEEDLLAGSEVVLHLHNHGANTWKFAEFSVLPLPAN